jgi:hypothetical protein
MGSRFRCSLVKLILITSVSPFDLSDSRLQADLNLAAHVDGIGMGGSGSTPATSQSNRIALPIARFQIDWREWERLEGFAPILRRSSVLTSTTRTANAARHVHGWQFGSMAMRLFVKSKSRSIV